MQYIFRPQAAAVEAADDQTDGIDTVVGHGHVLRGLDDQRVDGALAGRDAQAALAGGGQSVGQAQRQRHIPAP